MAQYEFVNVWPTDLTSMRVAYGEPNVLQCSVQFAYDRFFSSFDGLEGQAPVNTAIGIVNSNDAAVEGAYTITNSASSAQRQVEAQIHKDTALYGDTFPAGSF